MTDRGSGDDHRYSRRNVLGSASWATLQQFVTLGATAVSGIVLARVLPVGDFGVFSYTTTLASMGMAIMAAGLSTLAVKYLAENANSQRAGMTALVLIREFFAVVAYLILLAVSITSGNSETVGLTALSLCVLFARAFDATEFWFQSRVESQKTAPVRIGVVLAFLVGRIAFALAGAELIVFVVLYVLESVVVSAGLLLRYLCDRDSQGFGQPRFEVARELLGKSWILLLAGIAAQVNSRGDVIVIQALLGSEEVGIYSAAARFSELFYFLPVVFMTATFPGLLATRRKFGEHSQRYRAALQKSYDMSCWVGIGIASAVFVLGPFVIDLVYGDRYSEAGSILQIHVLALPFVFMAAVFSKWIVAENLLLASLLRHGAGAVLNLALNFALIPVLGISGAALATIVSYVVAAYLSCFIGRRTRVAGLQMSLALVAPIRVAARYFNGRTQ